MGRSVGFTDSILGYFANECFDNNMNSGSGDT